MSALPINAKIKEDIENGNLHQVRLQWVPRVGELIVLWSYSEQAMSKPSGEELSPIAEFVPPQYQYEVLKVVHEIHDITEKMPQSLEGHHSVTIHVKQKAERKVGTWGTRRV